MLTLPHQMSSRTSGSSTTRLSVGLRPVFLPEYAMSAEVAKKHEGWTIHASQANFLPEAYILPTWLVYSLWDQEFYHVRDLRADPLD